MRSLPLRHLILIALTVLGVLGVAAPPAVAASISPDDATKAAMIYNFGRFATWPPGRFGGPGDPVVLCVAPDGQLTAALGQLAGKPIGARVLAVRETNQFDRGCHIAYLEGAVSDGALLALRGKGVLTVGDAPNFARSGSIQILTLGRQLRFAINPKNAQAAEVRLSANLLRLASVVR